MRPLADEPLSMIVSRCDRLGDLILSLPVLGLLTDADVRERILHCSPYAADIGAWALHNGLCTRLWIAGEPPPPGAAESVGLSLFHCTETAEAFRQLQLKRSFGPRSRISTLWTYSRTVPQHRSRVEMSEMRYNWSLAKACLEWCGKEVPEFRGLPALQLPSRWTSNVESPDVVIVAANSGSAHNWPLENFVELAREALKAGKKVDFLVNGVDADERAKRLQRADCVGDTEGKARIVTGLKSVKELIAYLARSKRVISSSTGPLHIAHAAGVPVLGIYPDRPLSQTFARWRPDGFWHAAPVRYLTFSPKN